MFDNRGRFAELFEFCVLLVAQSINLFAKVGKLVFQLLRDFLLLLVLLLRLKVGFLLVERRNFGVDVGQSLTKRIFLCVKHFRNQRVSRVDNQIEIVGHIGVIVHSAQSGGVLHTAHKLVLRNQQRFGVGAKVLKLNNKVALFGRYGVENLNQIVAVVVAQFGLRLVVFLNQAADNVGVNTGETHLLQLLLERANKVHIELTVKH